MEESYQEAIEVLKSSKPLAQLFVKTNCNYELNEADHQLLTEVKEAFEAGVLDNDQHWQEAGLSLEEVTLLVGVLHLQRYQLS